MAAGADGEDGLADAGTYGRHVELTASAVLRGRFGLDRNELGEWYPIEYVKDEDAGSWKDGKLVAADCLRPPMSRLDDRLFPIVEGAPTTPGEMLGGAPAAAASVGAEAQEDLRTCWIDVDETGARFKERRKVVQEGTQEVPTLHLAGTYDQVNMGALASLEVVARRLLQYTEANAHGADQADWGAAKHLAGTSNPLDLVPDALRS
ncbi:unnamed protein product [Prorocentrum cordatum]|uniref:Uncharacterized protein n=1 Tax=Prorocentrum cordatum TaxID=2364126 RepID=A0ABN9X3I1_9DINO|nr:unnamed protein product [Polarella glacialis]